MAQEPIIVRALASEAEAEMLFSLADQAFVSQPSPEKASRWHQYVRGLEEFRPEQLRGAFRGDAYAGGLILYERVMRVGVARLPVGCIGAVVTHPDQRMGGVATALMADAIAFAQEHGQALLLLDGIPGFYHRFGYIDVFDLAEQTINRAAVLAQSPGEHTVRAADEDDAQALRDCFERRFGGYTGSFTRTPRQQLHHLRRRAARGAPTWIATSPAGAVEGYMVSSSQGDATRMLEVCADSWSALLALAQHHARLLDDQEQSVDLRWALPPDSQEELWLIDHLQVPLPFDTADDPQAQATVRTSIAHAGDTAWMARITSVDVLARSLLPKWQRRWQQSLARWQGAITMRTDAAPFTLVFADDRVDLASTAPVDAIEVRLTPQSLIQLVFGYRTVAWAATQPGNLIPPTALAPLSVLFDAGIPWIPATDGF